MNKELELLKKLIKPKLKELLIGNTPFLTNKTIDINSPFKFPNSEKLITLEKNGINIFKLPLYQFRKYVFIIDSIMNDY